MKAMTVQATFFCKDSKHYLTRDLFSRQDCSTHTDCLPWESWIKFEQNSSAVTHERILNSNGTCTHEAVSKHRLCVSWGFRAQILYTSAISSCSWAHWTRSKLCMPIDCITAFHLNKTAHPLLFCFGDVFLIVSWETWMPWRPQRSKFYFSSFRLLIDELSWQIYRKKIYGLVHLVLSSQSFGLHHVKNLQKDSMIGCADVILLMTEYAFLILLAHPGRANLTK